MSNFTLNFVSCDCLTVSLFFFPAKQNYVKCVAGESLYIQLEGIDLHDADLSFTGEAANVTLVRWMDGWMGGYID